MVSPNKGASCLKSELSKITAAVHSDFKLTANALAFGEENTAAMLRKIVGQMFSIHADIDRLH